MKPDKVPDSVGKLVEDYWKPSLKILSDVKFLDSLVNFDKDNIPDKVIDKIRSVYLTNVNFDPDKVKTASTACEGLCRWVYAISEYDKVAKVVAPKKVALAKAEALYNDANEKLKVKRAQLAEIQVHFSLDDFFFVKVYKRVREERVSLCEVFLSLSLDVKTPPAIGQ